MVKCFVAVAMALARGTAADAALVQFNYSGVFDSGPLAGTSFAGRLAYDDQLAPTIDNFGLTAQYDGVFAEMSVNGDTLASSQAVTQNGIPDAFGFPGSFGLFFYAFNGEAITSNALPTVAELAKFDIRQASLNSDTGVSRGSFTLSAAPEPASWAMMVGGFALVGLALRRRQQMTVSFG